MAGGILVATTAGLFQAGAEARPELEGREVGALARGQNGWWSIVDGREVWRGGGDAWERVAASGNGRLNCILEADGRVLVGMAEAHLARLDGGELRQVEGFEATEGRETWHTPWGGPPDVRSLAVGPSGTVYANVHVGGIARSADGGSSWEPTIDINADVHQVQAGPDGLVLAAVARGLAISRDEGRSWSFDRERLHAVYARAVGLCGDTVLLTVSLGPRGGRAAVYRRPLYGPGGFEKCTDGLPEWLPGNVDTGCLATDGTRAAIGTEDGEVYASEDAGLSWRRVTAGLPPVLQVAFA